MKEQECSYLINQGRLVFYATILSTLTGCAGYVNGPRAGINTEPAVFAVQDDYVYYPDYECYYSASRHKYAYREGINWVARPEPDGVSVAVLAASPSVRMDFHDSPAQHHAAVVKQYPKNWKPPGSKPAQNQPDEPHDQPGRNG
jgi:hypothetical protein